MPADIFCAKPNKASFPPYWPSCYIHRSAQHTSPSTSGSEDLRVHDTHYQYVDLIVDILDKHHQDQDLTGSRDGRACALDMYESIL